MINRNQLVQAIADTLAQIPPLLDLLAPTNPIDAYLDGKRNNVTQARYEMQPGTLLVEWESSEASTGGQFPLWSHRVLIWVRARTGESSQDVADAIINGVPVPGNGLWWRLTPLIPGVYATNIPDTHRETDEEHVDLTVVITETLETGDYFNGS